ncbi:MAG TPA: hypothetical protein PKY58_01095 [Syntrophales bacterium]|mgnify:CR=1 FL=1|nr:hypothetical protein [Syntrophales bacterium]HQB29237.1 hypothetical protein [Syntrophales bacterium]HQN76742.1 hypothetical protein [Syntrophales bacterium]HQQ26095.1 hypothetical protein [Syntrophales bacterium]
MRDRIAPLKGVFFRRKEVTKTTLWFKLAVLAVFAAAAAGAFALRAAWLPRLAELAIHQDALLPSDAIVIENYDPDYLSFETAADLLEKGFAPRVFVPATSYRDPSRPGSVSKGIVDVMCRLARIPAPEIIPVRHEEPITLGVAGQIAAVLEREGIRSVIVVAPKFRSRRTYLVYSAVLRDSGIRMKCFPARAARDTSDWWTTGHGIQEVTLELLKLGWYRFYVLKRPLPPAAFPDTGPLTHREGSG